MAMSDLVERKGQDIMMKEKFVAPKIQEIISCAKDNNMCLEGSGSGNMCNSGGSKW